MDFNFAEHQDKLVRKLFKNVANTSEIRKVILAAKLPFTLLKPQLILDSFHLSVAMTKALYNMKEGTMVTRSFQTEILFCLSPTRNIKEALSSLGTSDNDTEFILIGDKEAFVQLESQIQGVEAPLSDVVAYSDSNAIRKLYQISDEELQGSTLHQSVISRIASKEFT